MRICGLFHDREDFGVPSHNKVFAIMKLS